MTPKQFTDALAHLELPATHAAVLFGYDARTPRRWKQPPKQKGSRGVPPAVELLLWLLIDGEITADTITKARAKRGRR